jgi:tetratricopeptide (TPR) repeat protein
VALEGPLKDLHIQDVFQLLDLGRKNGVLRVTSELRQTAGTVCFERGGVVAAAVGSDPQPLGARLVRTGKITAADLDRARSMQTGGDDRRLGDILVSLGAISRRELDRQLKAQIEEAVFELLRWSEGYFRFEEGAPCHAAVEAPVRFPTEALLMEAARRIDEWSRIGSKVSHLRLVPRLPPPEAQGSEPLDLVPFEWEVLAAVDGLRDLRSLAEMLGRSEFEVARTVYGLTNAGIVVLDDPAHPGQEAEPGRDLAALLVPAREALAGSQYDLAAGALEEVLRVDPLMPEARRLLGLCYAGVGRFGEALELWSSWNRLGDRTPGEEAESPNVARLCQSVETIMRELERFRD